MLENIANQPVNKTVSTEESCSLKLEEGKLKKKKSTNLCVPISPNRYRDLHVSIHARKGEEGCKAKKKKSDFIDPNEGISSR